MTYCFAPPLRVKGAPNDQIRDIDEAERFLLTHTEEQREIHNRKGILRMLQAASTVEQETDAANAFIGWLEAEGLLLGRVSS